MLMVVMVVLRVDKKSFCRQIKDITELIYRPIIGMYFESRTTKMIYQY